MLERVTHACIICLKYIKGSSGPVVGPCPKPKCLMIWKKRQKNQSKNWLLHVIDHITRYRIINVIGSTVTGYEIIAEAVFKIWIKIFKNPKKILEHNGRELYNK